MYWTLRTAPEYLIIICIEMLCYVCLHVMTYFWKWSHVGGSVSHMLHKVLITGQANIGIVFVCVGNFQWCLYIRLFNTQWRKLQAGWFILQNTEKATLNISMPYSLLAFQIQTTEAEIFWDAIYNVSVESWQSEKVLIHTDEQLTGEYWDLVRQDNR